MRVGNVEMGTKKEVVDKMLVIMEDDRRIRSYRDLDTFLSILAPDYKSPIAALKMRSKVLDWEVTQDAKDFLHVAHKVLFDVKDYQNDIGIIPQGISGGTIFEVQDALLKERALKLGGVYISNNVHTNELHIQSMSKAIDFKVPYSVAGDGVSNPLALEIDPSFKSLKVLGEDLISVGVKDSGSGVLNDDLAGLAITRHISREGLREVASLVKRNEEIEPNQECEFTN